MINIWDFKDTHRARITNTAGEIYDGVIISMDDAIEYEDVEEAPEDVVNLETPNGIYGFRASEVAGIVSLDNLPREPAPARKARTFSQARQSAAQGHIGA